VPLVQWLARNYTEEPFNGVRVLEQLPTTYRVKVGLGSRLFEPCRLEPRNRRRWTLCGAGCGIGGKRNSGMWGARGQLGLGPAGVR
jgi:hypothetical protein